MNLLDIYKTIDLPSTGEYKEKGSKFIGYASEIENEEDFKEFLESVKKEHFKARHHCFAYALGPDRLKFRHNDDGEPGGTAGLPIFNQIKSFDLSNICIIIVRYFGGTKLGVPGLIRAYKSAAIDSINNAKIITKYIEDKVEIKYDFQFTGDIMRIVNTFGVDVLENTFEDLPIIRVKIRKSKTNEFTKSIYSAVLKRDIKDIKEDEKVEGIKIKVSSF